MEEGMNNRKAELAEAKRMAEEGKERAERAEERVRSPTEEASSSRSERPAASPSGDDAASLPLPDRLFDTILQGEAHGRREKASELLHLSIAKCDCDTDPRLRRLIKQINEEAGVSGGGRKERIDLAVKLCKGVQAENNLSAHRIIEQFEKETKTREETKELLKAVHKKHYLPSDPEDDDNEKPGKEALQEKGRTEKLSEEGAKDGGMVPSSQSVEDEKAEAEGEEDVANANDDEEKPAKKRKYRAKSGVKGSKGSTKQVGDLCEMMYDGKKGRKKETVRIVEKKKHQGRYKYGVKWEGPQQGFYLPDVEDSELKKIELEEKPESEENVGVPDSASRDDLKVGSDLWAQDKKKDSWYHGRVIEERPGKNGKKEFFIHFTGFKKYWDLWQPVESVFPDSKETRQKVNELNDKTRIELAAKKKANAKNKSKPKAGAGSKK